jgi:hypothetical protein
MIRRRARDEFFLFTQNDHAILAAKFAEHVENERFEELSPRLIQAIRLHDAGWPLHDDHPTLNADGFPIDVFESTPEIALQVWPASAQKAEEVDPYAGLLVSQHVFFLAGFATSGTFSQRWDLNNKPALKFAVAKFQQREVERWEATRSRLGIDPNEDPFQNDLRILQAMDLISLGACCTEPPVAKTFDLRPSVGVPPIGLQIKRVNESDVTVDPWPFDSARLEFEIPFKRVPATAFPSAMAFQETYYGAKSELFSFALQR